MHYNLQVGVEYTRDEIHSMFGGSTQWFLPRANSKVVCACLTLRLNPKAPFEILVGCGVEKEKSAELLSHQTNPIPIFIKQDTNRWQYTGEFVCTRYSTDIAVIRPKAERAGRDDVAGVLFMNPTVR